MKQTSAQSKPTDSLDSKLSPRAYPSHSRQSRMEYSESSAFQKVSAAEAMQAYHSMTFYANNNNSNNNSNNNNSNSNNVKSDGKRVENSDCQVVNANRMKPYVVAGLEGRLVVTSSSLPILILVDSLFQ